MNKIDHVLPKSLTNNMCNTHKHCVYLTIINVVFVCNLVKFYPCFTLTQGSIV